MLYTSLYFVLNQRIHILLYHYCFTHIVMALYYIHFLQRPVLNYQINRSFRFIGFKPTIPLNNTHTCLKALCPGLPGSASTRKVKPIWILLKQETVSGSGIRWAICKSAPRSRQITTPLLTFFYRPDALPAAQPTVSKH